MITEIKWKLACHFAGTKEHGLMYKSNYKGYMITCEIVTPKPHGKFGKERRMFYADDFKDKFDDLDSLKGFIDNHIIKIQNFLEVDE
jgi:hypothetical protein